jgi:4'-phosphopantetheinyl transferase
MPVSRWALPKDEVHVWHASLEAPPDVVTVLKSLLSEEETHRALRYQLRQHTYRFVVGRGLLRILLGHYLGAPPEDLRFAYSHFGKPELTGASQGSELRFDLWHTHGKILYALSYGRDVGVDIEYMSQTVDRELIVERFCSEHEKSHYSTVPGELKQEAFLNCWTRKEAYIKARSQGLAIPLESFSVSLIPGAPVALLDTGEMREDEVPWSLHGVSFGPEYVAAVAVRGSNYALRTREWVWQQNRPGKQNKAVSPDQRHQEDECGRRQRELANEIGPNLGWANE